MKRCLLVAIGLSGLACASGTPFADSYALDFGTVQIGATATRTVDLHNDTGGTATILAIDAPTDIEFTPQQPTPARVPGGATLSLPVTFEPFGSGVKHYELVLHTDSSNRPTIHVALTGAGGTPCLQLSTAIVDFGNVVVDSSATRSLDLINCGDLDLDVTPTEIEGPSAPLFRLAGTLSAVPAGQTVSLPISYEPIVPSVQDTGYFVVSLTSVSPAVPATIVLQGSGVVSNLAATPNPLDCGTTVPVGTTLQMPLSLTNVANQVVTVSTVDVSEPGSPAAFSLDPQSWSSGKLNPGDKIELAIDFSPTVAGPYTGELDIRSDDLGGVISVMLTCVGSP
jgi:hypothetical protein